MGPSRPRGAGGGASSCSLGLVVLALAGALFIRAAISLNPYSGAGKPPMFGDYEAQRHWMEITYHLPVDQWYVNSSRNDLQYWGLDYPPLTAYHSWVCGAVAHMINPDWVALNTSRGFESYEHKLFMRYSVMVVDVAVFFTAVCAYCWLLFPNCGSVVDQVVFISLLLLQPSLILIDHGHFQYNCVSLGLSLWAIIAVVTHHDTIGSIAFSLALNYKQMELYHALPFFCFLFGKAIRSESPFRRVFTLGLTVIATFALCWLPFLKSSSLIFQLLNRLFPFARGLYEDKVANLWCTLSNIIKIRQLLSRSSLVGLSLVTTLTAILPSSLNLLWYPTSYRFLLALVNSSLSFFLFSFQVHEKSILLASLPVSLLTSHHPLPSTWFTIIAAFSMYPLLVKDGLAFPCWVLCALFSIVSYVLLLGNHKIEWWNRLMFISSVSSLLLLCLLSHLLPPPSRLPDLYAVLQSSLSFVYFAGFLLFFTWLQLSAGSHRVYQQVSRPITIIHSLQKTHKE